MEDIQRLLKMTYWADKRSPETVEKSVKIAVLEISGPGEYEFRKRLIDDSGLASKLPKDIDRIISKAMAACEDLINEEFEEYKG